MDSKVVVIASSILILPCAVLVLFSYAFQPDTQTVVTTICGSVVFTLAILIWSRTQYLDSRASSPITVITSTTEVTLKDDEGRLADVVKTQQLRVNTADVRQMVDHGIWAEGEIIVKEAKCDGLRVEVSPQRIGGTDKDELRFTFLDSPVRGSRYTRRLEFEFRDSFRGSEEYFSMQISRPMKELILVVNFPESRPVKKTWLKYRDESTYVDATPPYLTVERVSERPARVRYVVKRPKVGSTHMLYWIW